MDEFNEEDNNDEKEPFYSHLCKPMKKELTLNDNAYTEYFFGLKNLEEVKRISKFASIADIKEKNKKKKVLFSTYVKQFKEDGSDIRGSIFDNAQDSKGNNFNLKFIHN